LSAKLYRAIACATSCATKLRWRSRLIGTARMEWSRAARWQARDPDLEIEGGESLRVFARRVEDALASLAAAHSGRTLVIVTHGGVLDVAYRIARGLALEAPRDFEIANASLNRLRFEGGRFSIVEWGEVSHWRDALDEL